MGAYSVQSAIYVTLAMDEIDELHSTIELPNDANFFENIYMQTQMNY